MFLLLLQLNFCNYVSLQCYVLFFESVCFVLFNVGLGDSGFD